MNRRVCMRISMCFLGLGVCVYVGVFIISYIFLINHCTFLWNGPLNESVKKNVIDDLQNKFLQKPFHALSLHEARSSFSFLKELHIWYQYPGKLNCMLHVYKPLAVVNNNFIMVENGNLYATSFFDEELKQELPALEILPKDFTLLSEQCNDCLKKIPQFFFEQFNITLIDHTRFELQDKKHPNIVCVITNQTPCNEKVMQHYEIIKKQLCTQRFFAKKQWCVDMRFKNQILVAQKDMGSS